MVASTPAATRFSLISGVRPTVLMTSGYIGIVFSFSSLWFVVVFFVSISIEIVENYRMMENALSNFWLF